jgi:hypothetical protein
MKLWSDLVTTALLGTSRALLPAWPDGDAPLDLLLSKMDRDPPERGLLAAAAIVHTWVEAGAQALPVDAHHVPPAPADERPPCPIRAAECLSEILRADDRRLLGEWLGLLSASGAALPHRWLPELLDLACHNDDLRPSILPSLDARGRWLAAQHPKWQPLALPDDPDAISERWETGTTQARLTLLRQLRAADPERARDLAAATWGQDVARDRARFAGAFATNLSLADEPFLEELLADRSQQVQSAAADLLARLPGSGLVHRTIDRLQPLLALERRPLKRLRLVVTLPKAYTPDMAHDGIAERPQGMGKRAWWLLQMVAAVPPAHWTNVWSAQAVDLIALAARTDYEWLFLEAWSRAAARQHDSEWAEALLRRWLDEPWPTPSSRKATYFSHGLGTLVSSVPQLQLETWLSACLDAHRSALLGQERLLALLLHHQRPWGAPLTRALLNAVRALATREGSAGANWRMALSDLGYYASPNLSDRAGQNWPENSPWAKQIDRFVATLRFRRRMSNVFF